MRLAFFFLFAVIAEIFGFDLQCVIQQQHWDYLGYVNTCEANLEIARNSSQTVTSLNGKVEPEIDVKGFVLQSEYAFFLPQQIEKFLPNITGIKIRDSDLQSIRQSDLKQFPNLIELSVTNTKIEVLPDNLFAFNPELKSITFDSNSRLRAVGENVIPIGKKLEEASFYSAGCISDRTYDKQQFQILQRSIDTKCLKPDQFKKNLFGEEFEELEEKVRNLESQLKLKQNNLETLELEYETCDGILNAATKNMAILSYTIRSSEACREKNSRTIVETAIDIECEDEDLLESICTMKKLKIPSADMVIDNATTSIKATSLDKLHIVLQQTLFLPNNLAEKFPNLKELRVVSSGLFEINAKVLHKMDQLQTLNLQDNKLQEIPGNAFEHLAELKGLNLNRNRIEHLEVEVFKNLRNLQWLNLSQNLLTTVTSKMFENLISLETLSLSKNQLKYISADLLSPLGHIVNADLSDNVCINISFPLVAKNTIEETIIDNCILPVEINCVSKSGKIKSATDLNELTTPRYTEPSIEEKFDSCDAQNLVIHYPKTRISTVSLQSKSENIIAFKVVGQSMKFFPYEIAQEFPNLTSIFIERSTLSCLHKYNFQGLKELRTISITHNDLKSIDGGTFNNLPHLEHLDMSSNNIIALPSEIFLPLNKLRLLILSSNQIKKFTADLVPRRNTIQEFKIDDNQLEWIEAKTLRYLRKAKVIDFSGNICIDMKFDKTENSSRALVELSGEIDLNCSSED